MQHKILVVDDDRINTALVKFSLAERRYQVITAADGIEAVDKVKVEKPDLIILDVHMPRMNGYEFMAELKEIEGMEHLPVIMLTANETMEDVFTIEGVRGYFVKPVDLPLLIAKITECLGANPVDDDVSV